MAQFQPGDRSIPASFLNRVADAADLVLNQQGGGAFGGAADRDVILVYNSSGSDVARFGVLAIGDVRITQADNAEEFAQRVYMDGVEPAVGDHEGKFVVALEPIADGKIGRCVTGGLVQCQVNVNSQYHDRADIKDADVTQLDSGPTGAAKILWVAGTSGTQWAIVDINHVTEQFFWARVTDHESRGTGRFRYGWQEVEQTLADTWSTVTDGRSGTAAEGSEETTASFAINSAEDILTGVPYGPSLQPVTIGTIVRMSESLDASGDPIYAFHHAAYEVGFGKPVSGASDLPVSDTIELTITDSAGSPILDGNDAEATITVYRNTSRKSLYLDFISTDVFFYVKFAPAESGVEGCIFSRTEGMEVDSTYLPSGGIAISGSTAPDAVNATGDYGDDEHVYVTGHMYYEKSGGTHGGWKPWFSIDPSLLSDTGFKVKVDEDDTTPGFLDDEIIVDPGGGAEFWLSKTIDPGGANDNKLLLEHKDPQVEDYTVTFESDDAAGGGAEWLTVTPDAGAAALSFDDKGHERDAIAGNKTINFTHNDPQAVDVTLQPFTDLTNPSTGVVRINGENVPIDAKGHVDESSAASVSSDLTFTSSDSSVTIGVSASLGNATVDITGAGGGDADSVGGVEFLDKLIEAQSTGTVTVDEADYGGRVCYFSLYETPNQPDADFDNDFKELGSANRVFVSSTYTGSDMTIYSDSNYKLFIDSSDSRKLKFECLTAPSTGSHWMQVVVVKGSAKGSGSVDLVIS